MQKRVDNLPCLAGGERLHPHSCLPHCLHMLSVPAGRLPPAPQAPESLRRLCAEQITTAHSAATGPLRAIPNCSGTPSPRLSRRKEWYQIWPGPLPLPPSSLLSTSLPPSLAPSLLLGLPSLSQENDGPRPLKSTGRHGHF